MKDANKIHIRCAEKENGEKNMMKGMKRQRKKNLEIQCVSYLCTNAPIIPSLYVQKFFSLYVCASVFANVVSF